MVSGDATPSADREGDQSLLARISTEMVRAQKHFFGKGPTDAKSYFVDDMLFIVMKGGTTTAEKTMVGFGQENRVRDFRQSFENEMTERLTGMIEDLTGRKVVGYQSQILFDPDRVIEMFVFDEPQTEAVRETAAALLRDPSGESTGPAGAPLDPPSESGQSG